jgi:hypothetical protein
MLPAAKDKWDFSAISALLALSKSKISTYKLGVGNRGTLGIAG